MKNLSLLFLVFSIFLFNSCDDEEAAAALEKASQSISNTNISNSISEDSNIENEQLYYFSHEQGVCVNEEGEEGFNEGLVTCGDSSGQFLSEVDLKSTTLYGLNLKGATVSESKVSFKKLAEGEVKINDQTFFEKIRNPFTKLFDQHLNQMKRNARLSLRYEKKSLKKLSVIEKLKERILNSSNEEKKEKWGNRILELRSQVAELNEKAIISVNKKSRHQSFANELYELVLNEPAYTNPKIKNKSSVVLDGSNHLVGKSSNDYFKSDDEFGLSVWVSTDEKQNDKRILNFHHQSSPQSAININTRSSGLALGYRNQEGSYHEILTDFNYSDSSLIHVAATYDGSTFRIYLNGELAGEKDDSFIGFGLYPFHIGSYEGRSRKFKGKVDEISLWSNALGASAIEALYFDGVPTNLKRHLDSNYLLYWWRLGDKQKKNQDKSLFYDAVEKSTLSLE